MPLLTRSRLRLTWYLLCSGVIVTSLLPGIRLNDLHFASEVNSNWVHFLVYLVIAALPVLAWTFRVGIVISFGVALFSVVSQFLHGFVSGRVIDSHSAVINLLGTASGVLLGLNIVALRTRTRERTTSNADRPQSSIR
jgi:hypothetical protein